MPLGSITLLFFIVLRWELLALNSKLENSKGLSLNITIVQDLFEIGARSPKGLHSEEQGKIII